MPPPIIPRAADPNALSAAEFSLLTQIITRANEYAYIREPVGEEVWSLLRRGYLRVIDHNGKAVLKPTEAGARAMTEGLAISRVIGA